MDHDLEQRAVWLAGRGKPHAQPADHDKAEILTMRTLASIVVALAAALAGAQQIGQNKPADGSQGFTISMKVQLVVEAVVVKDKDCLLYTSRCV